MESIVDDPVRDPGIRRPEHRLLGLKRSSAADRHRHEHNLLDPKTESVDRTDSKTASRLIEKQVQFAGAAIDVHSLCSYRNAEESLEDSKAVRLYY